MLIPRGKPHTRIGVIGGNSLLDRTSLTLAITAELAEQHGSRSLETPAPQPGPTINTSHLEYPMQTNYLIIFEDGPIRRTTEFTDDLAAGASDGVLDAVDISDPNNPKSYVDGEWVAIPLA